MCVFVAHTPQKIIMTISHRSFQATPAFAAQCFDLIDSHKRRKDVDFYVNELLRIGGNALELGCGTGRVLFPVARAGIHVHGLEISEHMLSVCQSTLAVESAFVQSRVEISQGDMRSFELPKRFNTVIIPFRSLQVLCSDSEQIFCLTSVAKHLKQGGYLIFDVGPSINSFLNYNADAVFREEPNIGIVDGFMVSVFYRIANVDETSRTVMHETVYKFHDTHKGDYENIHSIQMHYFYDYELEKLLTSCGFNVVKKYKDFKHSPYDTKANSDLIIVARKCA